MQSKREPLSLLEVSEFHREKRENLLNGNKCIENQIHPISERINTCNFQSSSNPTHRQTNGQ